MNARTNFSYSQNPYKVRKLVTYSDGSQAYVDGFGKVVEEVKQPEPKKLVEFVTIGNGTIVHKNAKDGPICGIAGRGEGFTWRGQLSTKESHNATITCKTCLKIINKGE